jgi:exo-beta-1,3-glucanase (GH17 family)
LPVELTVSLLQVVIPAGAPLGDYRFLAALTQPGTTSIVDGIGETRFRVGTVPGGKVFDGLNFAPWVADQNPELGATASPVQIRARLATVAPWTRLVRLFGTGGGLDQAPAIARQLGLQVACGAWIGPVPTANDAELTVLEALGRAGVCDLLVVGSETLFRGDVSAAQLVAYMTRVKAAVPGARVATVDTYGALSAAQNAAVLAASDVVLYTAYPYWEGIALLQAATFLAGRHASLSALVPGKQVIVAETGWPTCGNTVGAAVPSPANAATYLADVLAWAKAAQVDVWAFSAFDEAWKVTREGPQGACWGVWDRLGNVKLAMEPVLRPAP